MATYQTVIFDELIKGSGYNGSVIKIYTDSSRTVAVDLTGCSITANLKQSPKSIAQATWATEDDTITISGDDNNFVTLHARNMDVPIGQYFMDVDILFPSGINKINLRIGWKIIDKY
jgi:hypothetical protein